MDLEFCTNEELVLELMKRATFVGLIVCSTKEKKSDVVHDDWGIYSTLNLEQTKVILENAEQTIKHGEN